MRTFFDIAGRRFGFLFSPITIDAGPYMDRYILYFFGYCIRLHRFYRGDDQRAPHDHPFWFITFPFSDYLEHVYDSGGASYHRVVRAWRFHFRPAAFRHIVMGRNTLSTKPFWTLVIAGPRERSWGFWPKDGTFVGWRDWK